MTKFIYDQEHDVWISENYGLTPYILFDGRPIHITDIDCVFLHKAEHYENKMEIGIFYKNGTYTFEDFDLNDEKEKALYEKRKKYIFDKLALVE